MQEFLTDEALELAALAAQGETVEPTMGFEPPDSPLTLEIRLKLLNEIGLALSSVRDIGLLADIILSKARELTGADAGSLYLVDTSGTETQSDDRLNFFRAQNDTITVKTSRTFPVSSSSLAGYVALTGKTLCFEDVYKLPSNAPYQFNPSFDREQGYCTRSVLVVPMRNHKGGISGVLQLINRKRRHEVKLIGEEVMEREVLPFDAELVELAASLASQAAVAIENNRLLQDIRDLFESFVTASASAIEDRDPSTSGHSFRVTNMTLALAAAAHLATDGPYKDVQFMPIEMRALRYAGLLHDFGKIGVPERVLTKSHKLEPLHFEVVKSRLFALRHERRAYYAEAVSRTWREHCGRPGGDAIAEALCGQLEQQGAAELAEFDTLMTMLAQANDPAVTFLPDDDYARQQELLTRLSEMTYENEKGERAPLIDDEEKAALSIRKGSLTLEEYRTIQKHAQLSYEFLVKIRWTEEYARIPLIAWGHHEKLNGKGYPRGVAAPDIPLETRMMTVADIYDALTASDRPYKKAMDVDFALQILRYEARDGGLDTDVVEMFISQKIYENPNAWIQTYNDQVEQL